MLAESTLFVVEVLKNLIAIFLALLVFILVKRQKASGKSLTDLLKGFIGRAKGPLRSLSIAIAFIVLLDYILPTEAMSPSAQVAFLAVFSVFALVPPWLPSARLFAIATVAFYVASGVAFHRLLPESAEGPDAMGVAILLGLFYLLFFASCVVRLICKTISSYLKRRSEV